MLDANYKDLSVSFFFLSFCCTFAEGAKWNLWRCLNKVDNYTKCFRFDGLAWGGCCECRWPLVWEAEQTAGEHSILLLNRSTCVNSVSKNLSSWRKEMEVTVAGHKHISKLYRPLRDAERSAKAFSHQNVSKVRQNHRKKCVQPVLKLCPVDRQIFKNPNCKQRTNPCENSPCTKQTHLQMI